MPTARSPVVTKYNIINPFASYDGGWSSETQHKAHSDVLDIVISLLELQVISLSCVFIASSCFVTAEVLKNVASLYGKDDLHLSLTSTTLPTALDVLPRALNLVD